MKAIAIVLMLLVVDAAQVASAASKQSGSEPTKLLQEWATLNSACRGGHGDDPKTWNACRERDAADRRLAAAGWCYGHEGEFEYQKQWHRCTAASSSDPTHGPQ